jgi:GT2 family glycosyltransferase
LEEAVIQLTVIIPVYSNWEDTLECLRNLSAQTNPHFRVLLADDGSNSSPPELTKFDFVNYTRHEHAGFAINCNRAAEEAISAGATHLLLLNNDTAFGPEFVDGWLRVAGAMQDAIVGPLIYWYLKPSRIWFSGGARTFWLPFFRPRREYRTVTAVDVACGCTLLVPAHVWRKTGGFDARYVTYFEDLDFMLRARQEGFRTYVDPDPEIRVWHKVGRSFGRLNSWGRQYRMLASSLLFIRTHYRGPKKYLILALKAAHLGVLLVLCLPRLPNFRALWNAVTEGLSA